MEFKQLEFFVTCADKRSFSKASEKLFTTQSNMSKIIATLEEEVGVKLFDREKNGVRLTPQGSHVYELARDLLAKRGELSGIKDNIPGASLFIAAVYDDLFFDNVRQFITEHKAAEGKEKSGIRLRVSMDILDTEGVMNAVSREKADVGFIYADRMHHNSLSYLLHKKSLEMYPIRNAGLTFTVGKNNKLFAKENVKTLNLSRQKFISLRDDLLNEKNYHHDRMLKSLGIEKELNDALQTNSADFLGYMLQETDYGYLHYSCFSDVIDEKRQLRHFPISHEDHGVTWCYIKRKYGALKSEVEEFLKKQI